MATTNEVCRYGKIFKNFKGLRIHQGRMKCLLQGDAQERSVLRAGQTQKIVNPESNHSVHDHLPEAQLVEPVVPQMQHLEGQKVQTVTNSQVQHGEGARKEKV